MSEKEITTPNLQEVIDNSESEEKDTTPTEEQEVSVTTDEYDKVWESDEVTLEDVAEQPLENNEPEPTEEEEVGSEETETNTNGVLITKPLKYKGNEIYVKDEDEAIALMQKGLDYEFKMSRIKPFRKAMFQNP